MWRACAREAACGAVPAFRRAANADFWCVPWNGGLARSCEFLTEQQRPCRPVGHLVLRLCRQALQEIPVVLVVFGDAVHAVIPQVEGRYPIGRLER